MHGPVSAPDLAEALNISPRTVLRVLAEQGNAVLAAGQAGRRRYGLRAPVRLGAGAGSEARALPVYAVDAAGHVHPAGEFSLLQPEGSFWDLKALGWPVDDEVRAGWWPGLPYPLYDMAPQGFLGRSFAKRHHNALALPPDPRMWADADICQALASGMEASADCSGHFILGERALQQFQSHVIAPPTPVSRRQRPAHYATLAQQAVEAGLVGSSAAGEFPKFTALREGAAGSTTPHVLVKFSAPLEAGAASNQSAAARWADLLRSEALALAHVAQLEGLQAAKAQVLAHGGRVFLELERFDRQGLLGRTPLVSLSALGDHLLGMAGQDWRAQAQALAARGLLSAPDLDAVRRLWWFGQLIANTDMHGGNLSLVPFEGSLNLAPVYDMLPMAYAPLPGGEVPAVKWQPQPPPPAERTHWHAACTVALAYWAAVQALEGASTPWRSIAAQNHSVLAALASRV